MNQTTTYRPIFAAILLLLIAQVTLLRDLHHLLPHQHEEHPVCESDSSHIHTSEYAHVECLICFFHFAPAETDEFDFKLQLPAIPLQKSEFSYQDFDYCRSFQQYHLRGPPVAST